MSNLSTKKHLLCALVLFGASAFAFILIYLPSLIETKSAVSYYTGYFGAKLISSATPVIAASILTLKAYGRGGGKRLLSALPFALSRVGYLLPYAFLIFSAEYEVYFATIVSLLYTLLFVILTLAEITVYNTIILAFINRGFKKQKIAPKFTAPPLDLDAPITLGVLFTALCRFTVDTVLEIINTVEYLVEYAGTYQIGEIVYMVFSYIAILVFAIITHILACVIKNRLA